MSKTDAALKRGLIIELIPEGNLVRLLINRLGEEEYNHLCSGWTMALHLLERKVATAVRNNEKSPN